MKRLIRCVYIISLFFIAIDLHAQTGKVQNLYITGSKEANYFGMQDYLPGEKNFYIYRNFIYFFKLRSKESFWLKVTDIRNDSIYYTKYYNLVGPWRNKDKTDPDTFHVHPSSILAIGKDPIGKKGFFRMHSLRSSKFHFVLNDSAKKFDRYFQTLNNYYQQAYTTTYEYIPFLTRKGLDSLHETVSTTYVADSAKLAADKVIKKYKKKNVIWFTPTNVNEIRGVNIGAVTMTLNNGPLDIWGVNLNADAISVILGVYALAYIHDNSFAKMADTLEMNLDGSMRGLSISGGGLFNTSKVYGVSINGVIFFADDMRGLMIAGMQGMCEKFSGVMISGLRNRCVNGKGLQIGLLNVCRNLKGIQIGLWNINSKRKLPFINWGV